MKDESSYSTGEFTIHLKSKDWTAYKDSQAATRNSLSAFLHEYMHYLQDTATYYGTIYRKQIYDNNIDMDVRGGNGNDLFDILCMGNLDVSEKRPTFDNGINVIPLGSLALKESMAQEAQRIVYGENTTASSQSVYYRGITKIIDTYLPYANEVTYLRFCIEDSCLMTDDPAQSLLQLLDTLASQDIISMIDGQEDEEAIETLYNHVENSLNDLGLLKYDAIDNLGIDTDEFSHSNMECMSRGLFDTEESFIAEYDLFLDIATKINQQRIANLCNRESNHSIIAQTLLKLKETNDFPAVFDVFGMPMINSTNNKGDFISNKNDF